MRLCVGVAGWVYLRRRRGGRRRRRSRRIRYGPIYRNKYFVHGDTFFHVSSFFWRGRGGGIISCSQDITRTPNTIAMCDEVKNDDYFGAIEVSNLQVESEIRPHSCCAINDFDVNRGTFCVVNRP